MRNKTCAARAGILWIALAAPFFGAALSAAGCAMPGFFAHDGRPSWVDQCRGAGSGAPMTAKNDRKVFQGCGVASGIKNVSIAMSRADTSACTQVAKTLKTYVESLYEDANMAQDGNGGKQAEEQVIVQITRTLTDQTLKGVTIADRWRDPADNDLWSLCEINADEVKKAVQTANGR